MTSTNAGVWGAVGDEIEVPYEGCVKVWSSGLRGGGSEQIPIFYFLVCNM